MFPGFQSFLSEERKLQGRWVTPALNHELHLGAPGATGADVPTITKVNSQSERGVTGIKNPFSLNIGNYKEFLRGIIKSLYWMEKHTTPASVQFFPFLSASSVSHWTKQVRRVNPSEF